MTTQSKPASFISTPKKPPNCVSKKIPVRGDFVTTADRADEGANVAVNGPEAKISRFSGLNGSILGFIKSYRILAPNPFPPINFLAIFSSSFSLCVIPFVRFTLRIFPV